MYGLVDSMFGAEHGCYAEYISIPDKTLAKMPAKLSYEEAASLPVVALTAYQVGMLCSPSTIRWC